MPVDHLGAQLSRLKTQQPAAVEHKRGADALEIPLEADTFTADSGRLAKRACLPRLPSLEWPCKATTPTSHASTQTPYALYGLDEFGDALLTEIPKAPSLQQWMDALDVPQGSPGAPAALLSTASGTSMGLRDERMLESSQLPRMPSFDYGPQQAWMDVDSLFGESVVAWQDQDLQLEQNVRSWADAAPQSADRESPSCPMPTMVADVVDAVDSHLPVKLTRLPGSAMALAPDACPTQEQLQEVIAAYRTKPGVQFDCLADRCNYRAHVFAGLLHERGLDCHKLFVHGDLRAPTPLGRDVHWNYHVAPLVYVRDAGMQPQVIDLSLFPDGATSPAAWAQTFYGAKDIQVEVTGSTTRDPPCFKYPSSQATPQPAGLHSFRSAQQYLEMHMAKRLNEPVWKSQTGQTQQEAHEFPTQVHQWVSEALNELPDPETTDHRMEEWP